MLVKKMDNTQFMRVWEIMQESFPPDERRPFEEQKALLSNPVYSIRVVCERGEVLGFIALWQLKNLVFVEHFAVAKECRNKGVGTKLLSKVLSDTEKTVCLEVEPPCDDITKRRVEFYKRNGFVLNEFPYVQPPLSAGQQAVPLMIMTCKNAVDKPEFLKIKDALYTEVYGL